MDERIKENRRYERYDAELKVFFQLDSKLQARVEYQLVGKDKEQFLSKRYVGLSKNVSPEGMCFISDQKLQKEDILSLEVYLPGDDENPIYMLGEVRWSEVMAEEGNSVMKFVTGVKLLTVNNQPIAPSISFDEGNKVHWSSVLESIFKKLRTLQQKKK